MNNPIAAPNSDNIIVVLRPNASPIEIEETIPPVILIVANTMIDASTLNTEFDISKINDAYVAKTYIPVVC